MRGLTALCLMLSTGPLAAETVMATRTIRPQQVLTAEDIRIDHVQIEGAFSDPMEVIGMEARFAIYPGRAVMRGVLAEPALIDRNQAVELVFEHGGLRIAAEGRALGRGAVGDRIRVMNETSRTVLFGTVAPNGSVVVSK
jgi:flagella basal body P-ring formation protein FlgA